MWAFKFTLFSTIEDVWDSISFRHFPNRLKFKNTNHQYIKYFLLLLVEKVDGFDSSLYLYLSIAAMLSSKYVFTILVIGETSNSVLLF